MVWDGRDDKPLSDDDRAIIGKCVRLTIPLSSRQLLGTYADLIRSFANQLDHLSRRHDISKRTALISARGEAQLLQQKLKYAAANLGIVVREGRPTNAELEARRRVIHSQPEEPS